ncbi:MAG: hypothetical protein ACP5E3_01990 [Bacteroidales bacterium]
MKNLISLTIILILIITSFLLFPGCNKEENTQINNTIEYPDTGFYGINILNQADTVFTFDIGPGYGDGSYHSMKCVLPSVESSLKLVITGCRLSVYNSSGWVYEPFNYSTENTFYTEGMISSDLRIHFCSESEKEAILSFYENGSNTPTRIKTVRLEN